MSQLKIPSVYMRGGTSKGLFFLAEDLPADAEGRERVLLRAIGSPDRYGKHIDGMGGATSSTSKVVIVSRSARADCDVDYLFGAVSIDRPMIDWSGNCGNLTSAVGPFAISQGLLSAPSDGLATVRIWQANIGKKIIAHVPMQDGAVQEEGSFTLDGVALPGAEIRLEFIEPASDDDEAGGGGLFPTGQVIDTVDVPGVGAVKMTLINAGNPTIFIHAARLGLQGTELQGDVNAEAELLKQAETIRAHGAVAMGLAASAEQATAERPHTPKLVFVVAPRAYLASDGKRIEASDTDLLARSFSMGLLHHAMPGTSAVAIAAAAAIPGTLVNQVTGSDAAGQVRFGHPSGVLSVGVEARQVDGKWGVTKAVMSRSARRLMEGSVFVPKTVVNE